jgi:rhamnosyltransferase
MPKSKVEPHNICGCVVLYNPSKKTIENIKSYMPIVSTLYAVDNSDTKTDVNTKIAGLPNVEYIDMGGNAGIAAALNKGLKKGIAAGYSYGLTMDQDSIFPVEEKRIILSLVDKLIQEYALVGLNYNFFPEQKTDAIVQAKYWLTSGNFVDLQAYDTAGGFNEDLFIDYVDMEFDRQLIRNGYQLCYLRDYSLKHAIGNPITVNIGKFHFTSMNHGPVRYYYRYRNSWYLHHEDPSFYRDKYFREMFFNIPKMLLLEKDKSTKLRMIKKGINDAKKGILGKYRREE